MIFKKKLKINNKKLFLFLTVQTFATKKQVTKNKLPLTNEQLLASGTPFPIVPRPGREKISVRVDDEKYMLDIYDFSFMERDDRLHNFVEITHIRKLLKKRKSRTDWFKFYYLKCNRSDKTGEFIYFESPGHRRKFLRLDYFHKWHRWLSNYKTTEYYYTKVVGSTEIEPDIFEKPNVQITFAYLMKYLKRKRFEETRHR
jgi:hypothetical protein